MKDFNLYDHILNEGHNYSKEDLQRIIAEIIYSIYSNDKTQYESIIREALENINEYTDLQFPSESQQV